MSKEIFQKITAKFYTDIWDLRQSKQQQQTGNLKTDHIITEAEILQH